MRITNMKTMIRIVGSILLLVLINSCGGGGGGGSASVPEGYSKVTVKVGNASSSVKGMDVAKPLSTLDIPPGVARIVVYDVRFAGLFTFSLTQIAAANVSEGSSFVIAAIIPNGLSIIYVQALDANGNVLYTGANFKEFTGGFYIVPIFMTPYTNNPPQFEGIQSISGVTTNSMTLSWRPATDDITPPEQIQYLIYRSTTAGGENLGGEPTYVTDFGQTSYAVTGLNPNTTYYFIVRAQDQSINRDSNTREMSATTLQEDVTPPPQVQDVTPPVFGGLTNAFGVESGAIQVTWDPATDDVTPPDQIKYLIFMGMDMDDGGPLVYDFSKPIRTVAGNVRATIRGLNPGQYYCFIARAQDAAGNMDSNTVEKCAYAPIADLAITNVNNGPDLQFTVSNIGNVNANNFYVAAIYTDGCFTSCDTFLISVPAKGSVNLYVKGASATDYRILADYFTFPAPWANVIAEPNNLNNVSCTNNVTDYCNPVFSTCDFGGAPYSQLY